MKKKDALIQRPALRYFGGKWRLAPWIIRHFPPHTTYVEPFAGAASVLLRKPPSQLEILNDQFEDLINFFDVLRSRPNTLVRAINLTPYARREFQRAQQPATDPIERARRLYIWAWQGRGRAGVKEIGGWRNARSMARGMTPPDDWTDTAHLYSIAQRLQNVQIENDDAFTVIQRYDTRDTLFYLDPPYVQSTRSDRWKYRAYHHEMDDEHHRNLADLLHRLQGAVVLSGCPSALYDELFPTWSRINHPVALKTGGGIKRYTEALWISPRAQHLASPLFSLEAARC